MPSRPIAAAVSTLRSVRRLLLIQEEAPLLEAGSVLYELGVNYEHYELGDENEGEDQCEDEGEDAYRRYDEVLLEGVYSLARYALRRAKETTATGAATGAGAGTCAGVDKSTAQSTLTMQMQSMTVERCLVFKQVVKELGLGQLLCSSRQVGSPVESSRERFTTR